MAQDVRDIAAADWQPRLGAHGEIVAGLEDIHQCVRIILLTPKGSVPHRPEFGSDLWRYLDRPIAEALPHVVRESVDALRRWEPRIEVIRVAPQNLATTHLRLTVEWRLNGRGEMIATEVRDV
ncbi:GPW/gp25 family protein [Neomegalonema sp.]|uniref:GPW/gp25 family protein n=1 Tax=Neomegalonema sp. TaxID=2039713 RepID=UPI00261CEA4D|nr:GPW/gp25 family protein [Neomegalonema sp.]MDD2870075.1 GPW/gp25 family protein [Neomegalonema sp.]